VARELLSVRGLESALKTATAQADAKTTRVKIRDGDNLMLIVRPGGGASWVLQYRWQGQRKPLTLGPWPDLTLKAAREKSRVARESIAQGIDPLGMRAAAKVAAKPSDTVRQLVTDWLARSRISDVYRGNIEAAMRKDVLPAIGAKAPGDVTRQDVLAILRALESRGALEMLRRVRMWLQQAYEFGIDAERVQISPVPTGHLKSFLPPDKGHFAAITGPADVPALMRAIRAYPKPVLRAALLFSAYVWQRPTEIREATWSEFDLDAARWVIPAARMKLRREHWVPLPTQAVDLLRAHAGVVGTWGWLWPGYRIGKPLSEAALGAALDSMGYKGRHTPHGFRAMARTICEEHLHLDSRAAEKHLAHEEADKVKRAYNRSEYWPERVALVQAWADWLDLQVSEP
jgi:integrase